MELNRRHTTTVVMATCLPTDVWAPTCQDALGERRGFQFILVKRKVLYQQRLYVTRTEVYCWMGVTWGLWKVGMSEH